MVKVEYFETATMRKTGKMKEGQICGTFFVNINPVELPEIPEVDPKLKGKAKKEAEAKREQALKKRALDEEQMVLNCKFQACNMVRELTGPDGVLVASIQEETKEEK